MWSQKKTLLVKAIKNKKCILIVWSTILFRTDLTLKQQIGTIKEKNIFYLHYLSYQSPLENIYIIIIQFVLVKGNKETENTFIYNSFNL